MEHSIVDFFYVNAFHLTTEYVLSHSQPFNTVNLPNDMIPFSGKLESGECQFMDLIDPKVSFDFLGGMFLTVFRRSKWQENKHILDGDAITDLSTFSHFDNTFPHVKIFSHAFSKSIAYFNPHPLIVCLTGAREWSPMYPFIHSVRLVEALGEYRKNELSLWKYIYCKNFALNNFIPDFVNMFLHKDNSGYIYISPPKLFLEYCIYPNVYLSIFYFIGRRLRKFVARLLNRDN